MVATVAGAYGAANQDPAIGAWIDRVRDGAIAMYVVCTFMFGMRMWARTKVLRQFGMDDLAMLIAWALFTCLVSLTLVETAHEKQYFYGRDFTISESSLVHLAQWSNAVYTANLVADKCSFGFFLLRTTNPNNAWQRITTIAACSLIGLFGIAYFGLSFTCAVTFDSLLTGQCNLNSAYKWTSAAWSATAIATDLAFGLVFVYLIVVCNLTRRARVLTVLIVAIGSLSGLSSLVRILAIAAPAPNSFVTDPNVRRLAVRFWSVMEVALCLAAPCVGAIQSFLRPYMDHPNPLGYQGNYERSGAAVLRKDTGQTSCQLISKKNGSTVDEVGHVPPLMQADVERGVVVKVEAADWKRDMDTSGTTKLKFPDLVYSASKMFR
ncbi:hypothetical protein ANO11243_033320 [Dothideomycetidae sp. 11243]|nr:hypothetical protein ANO11243_033320 [fungal sp. No.11243]